ncbi:MAG TPA: SCP2 sterol-binding domain-containing protein [Acidiferrobacterales bacterium]|nr:SCP2 sterol-binding domain-containing protein [Acidiferrobacterales bacterium]
MPLPFTALIEEVGNRLLRLDPETLRRLGDLQGRVVCIEFRELGRKLYLHPSESGFRLATECDQVPAVTLRGTLATFARLGLGAETETLAAGELDIEGDAALGQRLQRILGDLDLDWEEPLARLFGDPFGHEIGRTARAVFDWQRQAFRTFGLNAAEYFQEEARLLPVRYEVEAFLNAVDVVRADVDRLTARVQRLKNKLSA